MAKYSDSNPVSGAKKGGGKKNEDGRIGGSKYNSQCNDTEGDLPQRKQSRNGCKATERPNDDLKALPGRPGLEEGAY